VFDPPSGSAFPFGPSAVHYSAADTSGNTASGSFTVTVADTTPPTLVPPPAVHATTGPGATNCSAVVAALGTPTATDACSEPAITATGIPAGNVFPVGSTNITYTATDAAGNAATATQSVTVSDTTPPVISSATASPNVLWPANHRLVPVKLTVAASDLCDPGVKCRILSVTSNEPVGRHRGRDDDDECDDRGHDRHDDPDWVITGDLGLRLRAQRNAHGAGRVYTVTLGCADASGNVTRRAVQVTVPHDRRRDDRDDHDHDRDHGDDGRGGDDGH
jgi:hypothetical protein